MAQCYYCSHFKRGEFAKRGGCDVWCVSFSWNDVCSLYARKNTEFSDELDEYLFENHQVRAGCSSSVESLKYDIAREVAEKLIEKFGINLQYISREKRQKEMEDMYGLNLIKDK